MPAMLHALHVSVQMVSQQTPSMQLPLWHCVPVAHDSPLVFLIWHVGALQKYPVSHSPLETHVVLHAPATHA
jgi:hypothetical protein